MNKYLKSILMACVCFLFIFIFNFIFPRLLPGDPIAYLTGFTEEEMSVAKYEYYKEELHLNQSILVQFGYYIKDIFSGTLGYSFKHEATVSSLISQSLGVTLLITIPAVLISSILALVLGLSMGYRKGKIVEGVSTKIQVLLSTMPTFLIAFLLIILFGVKGPFPYTGLSSIGMRPGKPGYVGDLILHLILPITCIVIAITPSRYILVRNRVAEEMDKKYVLYAKERGLSSIVIQYKYILPNCISPFLMSLGMSVGICIGGSVVVETIFSLNGMGKLLYDSVGTLDYPLLEGILFITAFVMFISIIITDILSMVLDPRQRRKSYEE